MIEVVIQDVLGNDLSVVNAARVSFDKESSYELFPQEDTWDLAAKDRGLINYLATHGHWSPFSHAYLKFRVKAPVFVARQLQKHTVGLAWNEVSRRYVDSEPEFYVPDIWRAKAENVKQGSSDEAVPDISSDRINAYCLAGYNNMLKAGVCPEQARMVLPQSMMTEWIWSGSLYAFARVCKQRLDSHAQAETRIVAEKIALESEHVFPVSWNALMRAA